ncbi:MAG: LysM peptidoglycan-binding domain-containing protein [Clostridia bacterium]|nr:LysM peptidoglycan-binding domain-containing protein [Clostridia bacterium]
MVRLRSRLLVSLVAALILIGMTFTFNTIMGLNDANSDTQVTYDTVVVAAGDTLWDIAKDYVGSNGDIRYAVYEICNANDIQADQVYAGQELLIPENL